MIFQAGNASLLNLKEKKIYTKDSMILIHDLDGPIYYTDH